MDRDEVQRRIIENYKKMDLLHQKQLAGIRGAVSIFSDEVDLAVTLLAEGRMTELKQLLDALADQAVRLIETAG